MQHSRHQLFSHCHRAAFGVAILSLGACLATGVSRPAQATPAGVLSELHTFTGSDGIDSATALVLAPDGNFYGTASGGGANNGGTVFRISPTGVFTDLHDFSGTDGDQPLSSLIVGPDGNLWGTTSSGGAHGEGTIYKITTAGVFTDVHDFNGTDGDNFSNGMMMNPWGSPEASLTVGPDNLLYGVTTGGGANSCGTIFNITTAGTLTVLHSFSGSADGDQPCGTLVFTPNGSFYGTTSDGGPTNCGTVFQMTSSFVFTDIHDFDGVVEGGFPGAGLTIGNDGDLYGTTSTGGPSNGGTIFKTTPSGALTMLYNFQGNTDGVAPECELALGSDGNFYGTTPVGGVSNGGTVFQITPAGAFTLLYNFQGSTDGVAPVGGVIFGADGRLYGTTPGGGTTNCGTIYGLSAPIVVPPAPVPTGSGVRFDADGDGHADLLWYNTASGDLSLWPMNDQQVLNFGLSYATVDPSTGWKPVAAPDATGNGFPDLLWWNSLTGALSLWSMVGNVPTNFGGTLATVSDTDWVPVAAADTGGMNSTWSLVFQNTATGDVSRWTMQGTTVLGYGGTITSLGPNSPWQVVGAPDLDGDGKSDLLFYNIQTGEVSWWGCDLANSQVLSYNGDISQVNDTSWHLMGSEDANGDGKPDLLWWNQNTGEVAYWLMNGSAVDAYEPAFTQVTDTAWQPTAIR